MIETIYRMLFIQARGVLKKELMDHLRSNQLDEVSLRLKSTPKKNLRLSNPCEYTPCKYCVDHLSQRG
jgi:hypothetical protein